MPSFHKSAVQPERLRSRRFSSRAITFWKMPMKLGKFSQFVAYNNRESEMSKKCLESISAFNEFATLDIHSTTMYCWGMIAKELVAASTEPLILTLLSRGES